MVFAFLDFVVVHWVWVSIAGAVLCGLLLLWLSFGCGYRAARARYDRSDALAEMRIQLAVLEKQHISVTICDPAVLASCLDLCARRRVLWDITPRTDERGAVFLLTVYGNKSIESAK